MPHVVDVAMLKGEDMKPIIGSIGVMTDDSTPAQLWEFLGLRYGAIGHFRNIVTGAQWDRSVFMFWPLLDSLP